MAEQAVNVEASRDNMWRDIFGLNLQGSDLDMDSEVWLPRLALADALEVAEALSGMPQGVNVSDTRQLGRVIS